jgi:hypothetical protein
MRVSTALSTDLGAKCLHYSLSHFTQNTHEKHYLLQNSFLIFQFQFIIFHCTEENTESEMLHQQLTWYETAHWQAVFHVTERAHTEHEWKMFGHWDSVLYCIKFLYLTI